MEHYAKSYDIYGYVGDAEILCVKCAVNKDAPLFADMMEDQESCGRCLRPLKEVGPE